MSAPGGSRVLALARRAVRRLSRSRRIQEHMMVHAMLAGPGSRGVMVDVGAHHGSSLRAFADDGWQIYAFEPDPDNRAVLADVARRWPHVHIDERAVSHAEGVGTLHSSPESSGISSLSAFQPTHQPVGAIAITTLRAAIATHGLGQVDFLKIDAEGHDLFVLRGFPWEIQRPRVVLCEYEDRKTRPLGYGFEDLAGFLAERGYRVLVSEWFPIRRYGEQHRWKRLGLYPCAVDPAGWGNLIATRDGGEFAALVHEAQRQTGAQLALEAR